VALVAVACLIVAPAWVSASPSRMGVAPCVHGYTYGGYASREGVHGVAASIAAMRRPTVSSGHAAAWVGVGSRSQGGAGGHENEWLQVGIAAFPKVGLRLYVEEVSLGTARRFVDLGPAVLGRRYRVEVVETRPDVWQASLDGRVVGTPAYLPTGGGSWRAVATTESWAAGRASCNRFAYRFESVAVLSAARWHTLGNAQLVGTNVARSGAGFSAAF
jgi:hypothetical protein